MNKVKVLFFASLQARAGTSSVELELPVDASVRVLKQQIIHLYPQMESLLGSTLVSVNREFAFDSDAIPPEAEVALFPPVSGGSGAFPTIIAVTEDVLDLDDLVSSITLPSTGAACMFTGMVRGVTRRGEAHDTLYLEYEAYQAMAEAKMNQVADEIRTRWPSVEGIAILQRVGRLYPGTPTVLIACTAAHRDTGVFEAARYGIDRLKEIVPVWKKEVGPQGQEWVEGEYIPKRGD
jgi:MoaE-MoaD fusion protein